MHKYIVVGQMAKSPFRPFSRDDRFLAMLFIKGVGIVGSLLICSGIVAFLIREDVKRGG